MRGLVCKLIFDTIKPFDFRRPEAVVMKAKRRGFTIVEYTIIGTGILFALVAVYFGMSR
jgi:hypothetical protein